MWKRVRNLVLSSLFFCFVFFFFLKTNKPSWLVSQCTARLRPGLWRTSERTCLARTCPALSLLWINVKFPDRKPVKIVKAVSYFPSFSFALLKRFPQNLGAARASMSFCLAVIGGKFVTKGNMFFNEEELLSCWHDVMPTLRSDWWRVTCDCTFSFSFQWRCSVEVHYNCVLGWIISWCMYIFTSK